LQSLVRYDQALVSSFHAMTFLITRILRPFLAPANLAVLLLLLGVVRLWRSRGRRGLSLVAIVTMALIAIALFPFGDWLIAPLESRFPVPAIPGEVDGIILLGGAVEPRVVGERVEPAVNGAADRLLTFMALARHYPNAKLLLVGGEAALLPRGYSEAELTRDLLIAQGFDRQRMLVEPRSRNTIENAMFAKAVADPQPNETWLLVTSAVHMPRAVGCFRRAGWAPVPFPTDYRTALDSGWTMALVQHLGLVELAVKEWLGLIAYRLIGRTDSLFPSP
jgi:uncharacterized SAM-binding protein YcdF (DUF218 family)